MAKGKEVAKVTEEPKAIQGSGYAADAGAGFEDTTSKDYALPFLGILQKGSPQVDPDQDAYIEGAKAGQVFNTVTGDRYDGDKGIIFIPVHHEHKYVEWIPRDLGGGFVGLHAPDSPEVLKAREDAGTDFGKLPFGDNQLAETFYMYGIRVDADGNTEQCVIAFASTQIRAYKAWMTKARGIKLRDDNDRPFPAPLFAHRYRLSTNLQENKKGKWHGWRIGFDGTSASEARIPVDDPLYEEAKGLRELVMSGLAKLDFDKQNLGGEEVEESSQKSF